MENASKALVIAGAILISILIIAIGMYIYSSSTNSITSGIRQMDTQERQAFNSQWTSYEGTQTGSQIKTLITTLISNADTYQDEAHKVVGLQIQSDANNTSNTTITYTDGQLSSFIGSLNTEYTKVKSNHKYTVTFDYQNTSIIRQINVAYN